MRLVARRLCSLAAAMVPGVVLASVWAPEILHYYVPAPRLTSEVVTAGRGIPDDATFDALGKVSFGVHPWWPSEAAMVKAAEGILKGKLELPDFPPRTIGLPLDPDDFDKGLPIAQLQLASFVVPKVLLDAYKATGREVFLTAARDIIVAWAAYEAGAWFPRGYLWNDHAIVSRIPVLAEFWGLYRDRADYDPNVGEAIFRFVDRSRHLLAKEGHFTFSTNHGVMQNLALWHLALTFPTLPETERYVKLALDRMTDQMAFYVDPEGVVLEHSAGYQLVGVELLGLALKYLEMLDIREPDEWKTKFQQAKKFLWRLIRPDHTLPLFGDTSGGSIDLTAHTATGRSGTALQDLGPNTPGGGLYPLSGYAVWWDPPENASDPNDLAQTVVAWSYFPGHGHKHADELSVLLWAMGQEWWTNVGYWPYGLRGRVEAESWSGSSAPHLDTEASDVKRNTRLIASGWSDGFGLVDLERTNQRNFAIRRQVVYARPNLWIVLDSSSGTASGRVRTTWTASHTTRVSEGSTPGSYEVGGNGATLKTFILGRPDPATRVFKGSMTPFAGWQVVDGVPRQTTAIVVEQPAPESIGVTVWWLQPAGRLGMGLKAPPHASVLGGPERWEIVVPTEVGEVRVSRDNKSIIMTRSREGRVESHSLALAGGEDVVEQVASLGSAYDLAKSKYQRFRDLVEYRLKATYIVVLMWILQEVFFWGYRLAKGKPTLVMRLMTSFGWIAVGIWLVMVYLK